jgi:WD40 repeat protein
MQDIFISYARKDKEFVRRLHAALAEAGRDSWVDWEDIPPTTEWLHEIMGAIEGVHAVVFVLSPVSAKSPMCAQEIQHAVEHHKRLIPVVIDDVIPAEVPAEVAKLQWVSFRLSDDFTAAFASLLSALDTDIDWVRAHTRLLTRAIEWDARKQDTSLLLRGNDLKAGEAWLVQGAAKQPSPTTLQTEYVTASRRADARRQRKLVGSLSGGLIVTSVLALIAWQQRRNAITQRDEAIRQRNAALSKQLAAYSELLITQSPNLLDRATLLAIEAAHRAPGPEADRALRQAVAILPTMLFENTQQDEGFQAVAISPDGLKISVGGDDGKLRTWRVDNGETLRETGLGQRVNAIAYSPDGSLLASSVANGITLQYLREDRQQTLPAKNTREMAFSSDGHLLFAGGEGAVTVWDTASGERVRELPLTGNVDALALSPDGSVVAVGGPNNTVHVWNVATGQAVMEGRHESGSASMPLRLGSRDGGVFALAFFKDGKYLASGGQDHSVRLWQVATGKEVFRGYQADSIYGVAFSPVAPLLASAGMDGTARVWDLSKGMELYRLTHKDVVTQVIWDSSGNLLTVSQDGTARLWDMTSGDELVRLYQSGHLSAAALVPGSSRMVTGGYDEGAHTSTVRVWDSGKSGEAMRLPHEDTRDAVFSPDGKHIATLGETHFAQLWDLPEGKLKAKLPHDNFISAVLFSPDNKQVVTTGWDGAVRVWDVETGKMLADLRHEGRAGKAEFSPNGRLLATAGFEDGSARIWSVDSWQEVRRLMHTGVVETLRRMMPPQGGVRYLSFTPNGKLVTSGQDGTVRVWNVENGEELLRLPVGGYGQDVAVTPDGRYLVTDSENEIDVWSLPAGARVTTLNKGSDRFLALLGLSPDGRLALLSSMDQRAVQVRTMPDLKQIASLLHENTVFSAEFNREGRLLLTASQDTTARLWDTTRWQELVRLKTNGIVYKAHFSPDESLLVTASGEGQARVWITPTADLAATACSRLTRNLTEEEWRQYLGSEPYATTCKLAPAKH